MPDTANCEEVGATEKMLQRIDLADNEVRMVVPIDQRELLGGFERRVRCLNGTLRRRQILADHDIQILRLFGYLRELGHAVSFR